MRSVRRTFGAASVLALVLARPCWAGPVETCRHVVDRVGNALVTGIAKAEQQCLADRAAGLLSLDTQCIGSGGVADAVSDPRTRTQVDRLIRKADALLLRGCDGRSLVFTPPGGLGLLAVCSQVIGPCPFSDPSDEIATVRGCIRCAHVAAAHNLVSLRYPGEGSPAPCDEFAVVVDVTVTPDPFTGISLGGVVIRLSYPSPPLSLPGSGTDDSVLRQVQILPGGSGLRVVNDRDTNADGVDDQLVLSYVTVDAFDAGPFARVTFCRDGESPPLSAFSCTVSAGNPFGVDLEANCAVTPAP